MLNSELYLRFSAPFLLQAGLFQRLSAPARRQVGEMYLNFLKCENTFSQMTADQDANLRRSIKI
jgi:hypothetical protein